MNVQKNARMTYHGRVLLVRRVRQQRSHIADAAEAAGVSARTAYKWLARHRAGGEWMLHDRSSAPARRRHAIPADRVTEIERLRRQRMSGPAIARSLAMPRSTVGAVLRRLGLGKLSMLDAKPLVRRYQRERPGELIHIDTKKLGRIDGIGHRITGDRRGQSNKRGTGWEVLHVAIDDVSRLAYTEMLATEKREDCIDGLCAWETRFARSTPIIVFVISPPFQLHGFHNTTLAHRDAVWGGRQPHQLQRLEPSAPGSDDGVRIATPDAAAQLQCLPGVEPRPAPYGPRL